MKPALPGPALLGIASFFFAAMATLIGALHGQVGAAQLVSVRFAVGALAMAALFAVRRERPKLERWPLLVLRAFFGSCAVYLYVYAIGQIGVGPATMLNFISPCYSALFAPLFLKEKSSRWVIAGLLVATVGAALVALGAGDGGKPLTALGLGAGVLSGVMSGAATTSLRGLRRSTDAFTVYFAFCVFGLLFSAPIAAFDWASLDTRAWVIVLAMSTVSLIGQLLYTYALGFTETVTAGVTNQLAPVFSFGMAIVFLGDHPRAMTLGGAALCIAGVLVGLRGQLTLTAGELERHGVRFNGPPQKQHTPRLYSKLTAQPMSAQPYLRPTSALDRRTMGKYDVLCRLSTGGMSEIFLAYQKGLAGFRKIVVLKSILPDIRGEEEFVRMFLDEAKTTALFNHPHIAQVFDLDVDGETLFLAMEFVQGCTLVEMARACRQAKEPIPIGFTLLSVRDTALALHYAHTFTDPRGRKQTVIHRDVAEKNIMVTYEGTTKLLDFGIAKALGKGTGRTTIGMVKGTSGYMSPEQIRGEPLDARSDVFSLGVVLHECLTGMRLFHGKTPEEGMLSALREEIPPPSRLNPEVIPAIDAVVMKALMRDRDSRYATSLEFARAVEKAASGQMWHPEQSGELVLRHFTDRVTQTRELIESTQAESGEHTGETKVGKLIAEMQSARETGQTRTDPGDKPAPPIPSAPQPPERPARPSGVTINPPRAKAVDSGRPTRQGVSPGSEVTGSGETRETTDPATSLPPPPPGAVPMRSSRSAPVLPMVSPSPAVTVQLSGNARDNYDDDDVGAKTIPAAVLPGGIYAPPDLVHARRNTVPPPVPSAPLPPPVRTQDETTSGSRSPLENANGWATYDETDDDEPGLKTTIARPFDDELGSASGERTGSSGGWKLPLYVAAGMVVGLIALGGLMFALDLGPFASSPPPSKPLLVPEEAAERPTPPTKKEKEKEKEREREAPEPSREAPKEDVVAAKPPAPPEAELKTPLPTEPEKRKTGTAARPKPTRTKKASPSKPEEPEEVASPEPVPAPAPKPVEKEKPAPVAGAATVTLVMGVSGLLVTLNGAELGTTPIFNKPVPVGRQVFKIHAPDGEVRTLAVDVKPGSNSVRQDFDSLSK